jgi:hypothetical protein
MLLRHAILYPYIKNIEMKINILPILFSAVLLISASCNTNTDRGIEDKGATAPAPQNVSPQAVQDTADERRHAEIHNDTSAHHHHEKDSLNRK